jgi:hypothetical protein
MAQAKAFYKFVQPQLISTNAFDNQDTTGTGGVYGSFGWYHRLVQGSPSRLTRYREYDIMDADVHVSSALDIIAEEMCGNRGKNDSAIELNLTPSGSNPIKPNTVMVLQAALKTWIKLNNWDTRMFDICRNTIKYGDAFFKRPKEKNGQYGWVHPKSVVAAIVNPENITDIRGFQIKEDSRLANPGVGGGMAYNITAGVNDPAVKPMAKEDFMHFTLRDEMSDDAPFGRSVLRTAYRAFKQKELLEESLIIYRVQRAPERRVFYINTGKMPQRQVAAYLEGLKNEFRQKKVPNNHTGGASMVDATYNPASQNEDFFFAENAEGKGNRVEVLPGGQNLGELQDLDYFFNKMWMAMRIPQTYLTGGAEGAGIANDGRVGIAYLQEIKFSLYVERLQVPIEQALDFEFKRWLNENQIVVDASLFDLKLPQPSDFAQSRDHEMNMATLGALEQASNIPFISRRFAQTVYGMWTQEQVLTNERLLREEKGLDPTKGSLRDLPILYFPEEAEAGGFDGGLGGGGGGGGMPPMGGGEEGMPPMGDEGDTDIDTGEAPEGGEENQGGQKQGGNQNQNRQANSPNTREA